MKVSSFFICTSGYAEGTFAFPNFVRLPVAFREKQKKTRFSLVFCSLIRTFVATYAMKNVAKEIKGKRDKQSKERNDDYE